MKIQDIQAIQLLLSTPKKIAIIPHRGPDGDAMGSTLGLYHFLLKNNHHPVVVSPNEFPDFLAWMPGAETVKIFEKDKENCTKILEDAELIFTLDFNALHRTGEMEHVLAQLKAPFIMIDHHQKPDDYATFTYSDTSFGSTCEMIYNFILFLGKKHDIDKTIGTCIYTGILTDSGSFRFPKTTGTTHRIIAELIDLGVENTEIPTLLFDNSSFGRLQILGRALQNMKVITEHKTAYITLTQDELNSFGYVKGDTEGIVNYGLSIKGIVFAAIFIENKEEKIIKISFRSQGDFDVNQFARDYFNGGGHRNAAGGKSEVSMEETIRKFEDLVTKLSI
ncbi:MAG TPA: bifunctional oligoribonuclease/PAP phosphatase NrnA [Flavobacterium sp.]|jgi:nanoRNase/pAp phosphatase (c-di-AMP/oligoRNAs hydrolase)|uniref:DHH family phosphoesterase n=1 Tax=Flavobacterium sp. TaxID=239 RepID=UPI001B5AABD6|nr:bifunctional oligoribonuclease/PAP phosphatase NrnA [Flavobacterium sp.]MBP6145910.1 bifunctional oligoribonuclease/PAP phosphatase NrnA [Flavobacterium sp.]MBP7181510.1 bifunctional oligoribonuclease/PAP phosphatase NrnA [Flavobacterium sp.]MBP7317969.1 bifunctional oligoribonuclease/PAP phosphatase NrnA [Flavobacterium sp.]MBP8886418.1 bifunctional oligoribonuclease/PAP phosphatase NrnA [Flavobacterium sp.]HRL71057.1 bifunctional oligoribonuclease/PAP phosphatase NrnA [Flavobacterium sp.]